MDGKKEIQQTLVYCALMCGQKPEKMEIEIAQRFLIKNYYNLSIDEIIESFELNNSGKHWKIIEPFGSFNTLFIGKIISSYIDYKNKIKKYNENKLIEPPKKDLISYEEAKPYLKKLSAELKKIDLKFRINNKKVK